MARIPFTLRIDSRERTALQNLSKVEGRPINQLLNEAIKAYLSRRGQKERELETTLADLRAYRKQDPGFRRAIAAFVEAEATLDDPLEGEPVEGQFVKGQLVKGQPRPAGPVQSKIREILGA
jgi:predicted transcriptional regulator